MDTAPTTGTPPANPSAYGAGVELELRRVDLPSGRIAYVEAGAGRPIVLVHGLADHLPTWRHQLRGLASAGRVIALDLPGHGQSDKPLVAYTPAFFVDAVHTFLEALGLRGVALAGNGMGGAAALGVAVRHPERIACLALIAPTTPGIVPKGRACNLLFRGGRWPALTRHAVGRAPRWVVRMALRDAVADAATIDGELVAHAVAALRQPGAAGAYVSAARHWNEWTQFRPRMAGLSQPTLLLWGERDRMYPIRQAGLLQTLVPQARLLALPCGHLPQRERPDAVTTALAELLADADVALPPE